MPEVQPTFAANFPQPCSRLGHNTVRLAVHVQGPSTSALIFCALFANHIPTRDFLDRRPGTLQWDRVGFLKSPQFQGIFCFHSDSNGFPRKKTNLNRGDICELWSIGPGRARFRDHPVGQGKVRPLCSDTRQWPWRRGKFSQLSHTEMSPRMNAHAGLGFSR